MEWKEPTRTFMHGMMQPFGTLWSLSRRDDKLTEIKSPFHPDYYPPMIQCKWNVFTLSRGYIIGYKFTYLSLGSMDAITLRDWRGATKRIEGNTFFPTNYWLTASQLDVHFISKRHYTFKGFKMEIEILKEPTACKGPHYFQNVSCDNKDIKNQTSPQDNSLNPFYPFYPNNIRCTWYITASKHQVIRYTIAKFNLAQPGDSLEIREIANGTTSVIRNFTTKPNFSKEKWVSSHRNLRINFKSDNVKVSQGFEVIWACITKTKACSTSSPEVQTSDNKEKFIQSPFFPDYYANDQDCKWIIEAPKDKIILFSFTEFNLVQPEDYLEIRDGVTDTDVMIRNFTTKPDKNDRWTSSGRYVFVRFKSDKSIVAEGFKLAYKFVNKPEACSSTSPKTITSDVKSIQSPFHPDYYSNNHDCKWLVKAPLGKIVKFLVSKVDLVKHDFLEIRDGVNESAMIMKNVSTTGTESSNGFVQSTGRFLWVRFKSDHEYVGKGFNLLLAFDNGPNTPQTIFPIPTQDEASTQDSNARISRQKKTDSSRIILGVGVGSGLLVLVFLIVLFVFIRRRQDIKKRFAADHDPWEIDIDEIDLLEEIGKGAFGKVWKGRIHSTILEQTSSAGPTKKKARGPKRTKDKVVAVKMLHDEASALEKSEFIGEINFMKNVGSHKNITTMLACCTRGDQVFLIVEYAQHGDLLHLLKDKRNKKYVKVCPTRDEASGTTRDDDDNQQQSMESLMEEFVSFSWQIAQGMEYLASKGIVHRDLAARNILVADGLVAKVADFGLSRNVTYATKLYQAIASRRLPLRWMSPEALTDQTFTTKSDVWSYGVVLWEIFSFGKLPYHDLYNEQLPRYLNDGQRMQKPDLCPDEIYELMIGCWNGQADNRPTFADIIKSLEVLMTRDKPYVELIMVTDGDDGYMVPVDSTDVE